MSVHPTAPGGKEPGERALGGHRQLHGRAPSWLLVLTVMLAFTAGGVAIIIHLWWLFWVCVGVAVMSIPVGKAIHIMDDTVMAGNPAEQPGQEGHVAEDTGSAADPGVDVGVPGTGMSSRQVE